MNSRLVREKFIQFFEEKKHLEVPSAPIVLKNDPTLMFTNAGMNQFKDIFLGNEAAKSARVVDFQKCLRVSGKHNDLEEVGVDTYHHTMFEMMGNWSFGDYFKTEAIAWAYEFLIDVLKVDKERVYATVFSGEKDWGLGADEEAAEEWKKFLPEDRILYCDAKDNFWEMGETGPSGPCSEIHVDFRSEEERKAIPGAELVNMDHPQVIEIWNLVFIQFNRLKDRSLEPLPAKHVDTGMGFERLVRVLQGKTSNYDTDIFMPLIKKLEEISGQSYGGEEKIDIAFRVIVDHIRAVSFTIIDGQLPSNTGAGYVIRRILRRAVRYGNSVLEIKEPFLTKLLPVLEEQFGDFYPEIVKDKVLLSKVINEEEASFLRTLDGGLKRLNDEMAAMKGSDSLSGKVAFELYDTFGFPIDLTRLILAENDKKVDEKEFESELSKQKERSRADAAADTSDWTEIAQANFEFVGYDELEADAAILKYRTVENKKGKMYQIVTDRTPFYAESGGQVGDTGMLISGEEKISIIDTQKDNKLYIHICEKLPSDPALPVRLKVNAKRRSDITKNHTATHLLHASLRDVLGEHVEQKGSLVSPKHLRFDYSHFSKLEDEELAVIEKQINERIRENISLDERRNIPIEEAKAMGAMALFGEKYGDEVRVIVFDPAYSVELCGGTHVQATGEIGYCKITTETSVAAGVRRIEAITGEAAAESIFTEAQEMKALKLMLKSKKGISGVVQNLMMENTGLKKDIEKMQMAMAGQLKDELKQKSSELNGLNFIAEKVEVSSADALKKISFDLKNEMENLFMVLAADTGEKALLSVLITDDLISSKELNAGQIIRDLAKNIQGGGGGQAFYATAGGSKPAGIADALREAKTFVESL